MVPFEHKVLIFGGISDEDRDIRDEVLEFDLTTREFRVMPSWPSDVPSMAGVRWGDQAVLIAGYGENGPSKKVCMYDSKTGNTTKLPSLLEERSGYAAVHRKHNSCDGWKGTVWSCQIC